MLCRILFSLGLVVLLAFELAPGVQAAYNGPTTLGAMTGDCTAPSTSSSSGYVTSCTKIGGVAAGPNATTASGFEPGYVKITTGATYTTAATDQTVCIFKTTGSATAVTLTLPGTVPAGQLRTWKLKDCKGDAATNNVTVTASSGTIDGAASFVLATGYQETEFVYDGSITFVR